MHLLLLFRRAVSALVPKRVARITVGVHPVGVVAVTSMPNACVTLGARAAAVVTLEVIT